VGRPSPVSDRQPPTASQHVTVGGHAITLQSVNIAGDFTIDLVSLSGDATRDVTDSFEEGLRLFHAKDYNRAIAAFQEAASATSDHEQITTLLLNCAAAAWHDQKFAMAEHYALSAISEAKAGRSTHAQATSEMTLAMVYLSTHQIGRAEPPIRHSLEIFRKTGDRSSEALSLSNLAVVLGDKGDLDGARKTIDEALALHRQAGNRTGEANALGNIAVVMGRGYNEAADKEHLLSEMDAILVQALTIWSELSDRRGQAQTLSLLAANSFLRGQYQDALDKYASARSIYKETGNVVGEAEAMGSAGIVKRYSADTEGAIAMLNESIELYSSLGIYEGSPSLYRRLIGEWSQNE